MFYISWINHQEREEKERLFNAVETVTFACYLFHIFFIFILLFIFLLFLSFYFVFFFLILVGSMWPFGPLDPSACWACNSLGPLYVLTSKLWVKIVWRTYYSIVLTDSSPRTTFKRFQCFHWSCLSFLTISVETVTFAFCPSVANFYPSVANFFFSFFRQAPKK